jgi:hypothetical protein
MANRAYLYSADSELKKIRDISENRNEVPLVYKILLGINCSMSESQLWNYPHPIAIKSDFKAGLQRFYDFYAFLATQPTIDGLTINGYIKETKAFFEKHPDRVLDYFFMEGGEAYDLTATDDYRIEKENTAVFVSVCKIAKDIEEILMVKPLDLFSSINKYRWLQEIKNDPTCLDPYWTHVTFFSFNKTQ